MMKLEDFPEEYIKKGKFKLHSGESTDTFYDVNDMLANSKELRRILKFIGYPRTGNCFDTYVGIATGGAIIASQFRGFAMIKDGELKGEVRGDFCLIDDVVTTESSLVGAINIVGRKPLEIFVVVDRREGQKIMNIKSMYGG